MIEENYRKMSGINQSMLKELPRNPGKVKKYLDGTLVEESKAHFVFGSMVDILLTEKLKSYKKKFIVCNDYPTDSVKEVIDKTLHYIKADFYTSATASHILSDDLMTYPDQLEKAMNECGYQTNWKKETRIQKLKDLGNAYFRFNGVDCKCELDGIVVDHDKKRIIPFDYKTTGDMILNFPKNVFKYGYDKQAVFYTEALRSQYPDYKIHPFRFIVVNRIQANKPIIFKMSSSVMENALHGYVRFGTRQKGITQLLEDFNKHVELDKWDYPIDWYDNQELLIDHEV